MMKQLLIRLIRFYRRCLSPHKPPCCRYYPTCSAYAIEAIEARGAFVGLVLAVWRILRCNPFSKGGYDPVPLKGQKRRERQKEPRAGDRIDAVESFRARKLNRPDPAAVRDETDLPISSPPPKKEKLSGGAPSEK